ncbi:MAG: hypothetical protein AB7G28_17550 [Pirellulales bacterium]
MHELRHQIARAQRCLILEQFLARSVWCLSAALAAALVAIAAPRVVAIADLPANWDAIWFLGAAAAGIAAAAVWTFIARRTALDAAIEIDRRFDLRERIASSISLSDEEQRTEAGQALVKDAVRAAGRIDVGDKFRPRLGERAWLPLVPAALTFLVILFFNPSTATSSLDPNAPAVVAKQINTAAESARKKLEEQRKEAERRGLKEAESLFKRIEAQTDDLAKKKDLDRTKAAVKLNDLARQLTERRKQLGGKEGLQKQLQSMKSFDHGPAEKIAEAMKQGDFQEAAKQLEKLAQQLRDGKLDPQQKAELAKQLEQLQKKLADAAQAHQQAMDDLQKQIAQQKAAGDMAKAGELQQKLDQMAGQSQQMQQMQQLSSQLGQMQEGMKQGDSQKTANAMQQMAQQLSQMQQEANEVEMLDSAMDQLQMAKDAMSCKNCQGAGCAECEGSKFAMGNGAKQSGQPGGGIGTQRGNHRPSNDNPKTSTRESRVRGKPGQGAAVYAGTIAGPNIKGNVEATIQQEMASFQGSETDPLTTQELPRNRREHAEEYFNQLREGK